MTARILRARPEGDGVHVVEVGGLRLQELINLVAQGVIDSKAVVAVGAGGMPVVVWVDELEDL